MEKIQEKLEEINEGERCLESKYNEEYDDWYNSDVPEIFTNGIGSSDSDPNVVISGSLSVRSIR